MDFAEHVARHLDALAKPQGSLGKLERLAARLCVTQRTLKPATRPRKLLLFAGDHGVVAEGVGIWPSAVTAAMIDVIDQGRACCSALAAANGCDVALIDVGSAAPVRDGRKIYQDRRVRHGSSNLAQEPALTPAEFWSAWQVGDAAVAGAAKDGIKVIAVGELGIGNTTPAAALIALLTNQTGEALVGAGAGATTESLAKKTTVVRNAVARARQAMTTDTIEAIASIAGFEIVAMAGAIAAASQAGITVVLDGVVTSAAGLIARMVDPSALDTAIAAHNGAEPAHKVALDHLALEPFLDWQLRLGEGTGALLLLPLLDAAAALVKDVALLSDVTG